MMARMSNQGDCNPVLEVWLHICISPAKRAAIANAAVMAMTWRVVSRGKGKLSKVGVGAVCAIRGCSSLSLDALECMSIELGDWCD